jgi:hypothetical protein
VEPNLELTRSVTANDLTVAAGLVLTGKGHPDTLHQVCESILLVADNRIQFRLWDGRTFYLTVEESVFRSGLVLPPGF